MGHSFAVDFVELQPVAGLVDVEAELAGPDEARVEYSRGMLEIVLPKVHRRKGHSVRITVR